VAEHKRRTPKEWRETAFQGSQPTEGSPEGRSRGARTYPDAGRQWN